MPVNRIAAYFESDLSELIVVVLTKRRERYVFLFHRQQFNDFRRTVDRFARAQDLDFTWHDAKVVYEKARGQL